MRMRLDTLREGLLTVLGVGAVIAVLAGYVLLTNDDPDQVTAYCSYGAVSQAQLDGCVEHVSSDDIDALDTEAARYARGERDGCGPQSGPFCQDAGTSDPDPVVGRP